MSIVKAREHVLRTPDGRVLQQGITFDIAEGDRLGITGPSGCGKSTLLREIAAIASRASEGEDTLDVAGITVDYLAQADYLFPWFTPKQNLNAWLGRELGHGLSASDLSSAENLQIHTLLDRRFSALSGGERQRVALWTALARPVDLLIIDEPFTALDIERKSTCLEALSAAFPDRIKSMVFVSHDYDVLTYLANRIVLFNSSTDGGTQTFEFPGGLPSSRREYLGRRTSDQYANLLTALTRARDS